MTKPHTTLDVILDIFIALTSTREKQFQRTGLSVDCMCYFGPQVGQSIMWQRLLSSWWKQRGRDKERVRAPWHPSKKCPVSLFFPTRPQFPQAFSNVSSSFESSKGLNFWFGHCPHGLIISEMPLQTEPGICGTCLRGFSPSNQSLVNETSMCMLALPIFLKCCSFLLPIALSGDKTSHWPETRHETGPAGHAPRDLLGLCSPGMTSTCCHLQGLSFHMCGLRINLRSVCLQSSHSADGTISPAKIKVK